MIVKQTNSPQTPNTVAGVSKNTPKAPAIKYPLTMANGDILHEIIEHGRHRVEIIERTDPLQYVKFHGLCSCGVQGRYHSKQSLLNYIEVHLNRSINQH